jgi:hypothetical protein
MKPYFLSIIILINFSETSLAQKQILDVPPSGRENRLAVTGGDIRMRIDSNSKLEDLIKRLEGNWEFSETGKMYWIGYTEDMYSIASRKNSAIKPLLDFIDTSKNFHARSGAICCLHLIGIDSKIKGRFYEEFNNAEARSALLSLLKFPELQPEIISLLIRDRHLTDIPKIFEIMITDSSDCWALNNYITQFSLRLPINQDIPYTFNEFVTINYTKDLQDIFRMQLPLVLNAIFAAHFENVEIDRELLKSDLWGLGWFPIISSSENLGKTTVSVKKLLYKITEGSYIDIGCKLQYYLENSKLWRFRTNVRTYSGRMLELIPDEAL